MSYMKKEKGVNFDKLNHDQKVNCIKNLLFNKELNEALSIIIEKEKKDLELINIIVECLDDDLIYNKVKENLYLESDDLEIVFLYSKIIGLLSFYKKDVILKILLESLNEDLLKRIANYEYSNKTVVSISNSVFNKFCSKYRNNENEESIEVLELTREFEQISNNLKKRNVNIYLFLIPVFILLLIFIGYRGYQDTKILSKYKGKILPGIYLNNKYLGGMNKKELKKECDKQINNIKESNVLAYNINEEKSYSLDTIGVEINTNIYDDIISYNNSLSVLKKIKLIKSKGKEKTFKIKADLSEKNINSFISTLKTDFNKEVKEDSFYVDSKHEVIYDKGYNGFVLDEEKTKDEIEEKLSLINSDIKIEVKGNVEKVKLKYDKYSMINKKVSSYTTYFENAGNRAHNIVLAASKLNGTLLEPGETFSYLKNIGPFSGNGYLPAPVYINSQTATANGGGVCQLASTLYMANLYAGLEIVQRRPHTFAATYVPKGLDATIYSPTTDYQFKNNYDYPIYVVSYASGNYLTVSIWTNENTLGNKTFEPYSYYSNGGYEAYLKIFEDGKYKEQRYLGRSVYKQH